MRLIEEEDKEEMEKSVLSENHERFKEKEKEKDLQLNISFQKARLERTDLTAEQHELYAYHKTYGFQMEYFNDEELAYYENMLKLEKIEKSKYKLNRKIKCKEDKHLGAGSFGTVVRGFCVNNKITMAIKRVHVDRTTKSEEEINKLQEEVNLLSELQHANIVKYYHSEMETNYLKIYLEYVDTGSIARMLNIYGALKEEVVIRYTRQLLQGLEYLHYHGIIHRDIKGGNILVNSNGVVKLADFGCAKKIMTYASSLTGTVCWMAPEVG